MSIRVGYLNEWAGTAKGLILDQAVSTKTATGLKSAMRNISSGL